MLPIFKHENVKSIVEIGSEKGINTRNILEYCMENDGKLTSIDPDPNFDTATLEEEYEGRYKILKTLSLESLPSLDDYIEANRIALLKTHVFRHRLDGRERQLSG